MGKSKFRMAALTALVCGGVVMVAQDAGQEYPHAFPRQGTRKILENDHVTVWEVNWLRNIPQRIHRHRYDMAGVYLRYGFINVTTPEGKVTASKPFEVPRPYFQLSGITHREEAVGGPDDPERLAIMVDLKEPAAGARLVTLSEVEPAFPREGAKDVLDNARVRMWDYTFEAKKPTGRHVHVHDSVEVFVTGGTVRFQTAEGPEETTTFAPKDARFVPRGRVDTEEAVAGSPRVITIELK
jgi:quercetin dioxygenase-like cupin family protein